MVLSYTTSPAYHLIAESDDTKAAALFDEGHYMQIEVAGKLAATDQPELADKFLDFMLTEAFQSALPQTNWMYPAVTPAAGLPEGFDAFRPAKSLLLTPQEAQVARVGIGRMASRARPLMRAAPALAALLLALVVAPLAAVGWRGVGMSLARPTGRPCGFL